MKLLSQKQNVSTGGVTQLLLLVLPLLASIFPSYFVCLLEKLFLSRISTDATSAAVSALYAAQIFQIATISLSLMAQVFVGRWYGAKKFHSIGPGIWQFIWFALVSMLVSVPASELFGSWYFSLEDQSGAIPYFRILVYGNFLYPLATALSCFFLGQKKIRLVVIASCIIQGIDIILSYLLIFNLPTSYAVLGGAIGAILSQILFCLYLGAIFLNAKNHEEFHSRRWKLNLPLFWDCIRPGLFRACNRILYISAWAFTAHILIARGGDHLLFLSLGGSLGLFIPFLFDAIYQAQTVITSNLIGEKNYLSLHPSAMTGIRFSCMCLLVLILPLLFFPLPIFHFLFPNTLVSAIAAKNLMFGSVLWFICFTLNAVPISYILSFKDTKFYLWAGGIFCIADSILIYFLFGKGNLDPSLFWGILSITQIPITALYFWRMFFLCKFAVIREKIAQ